MTTADYILQAASDRTRRRPLFRRFREGVRVLRTNDGFELRIDMGGLGFEFHGTLQLRARWQPELTSAHIDRFLHEMEEGFVAEYDRNLAKREAA